LQQVRPLRRNIRGKLAFKHENLVFQLQLAFFQTLQLQLIHRKRFGQPGDDLIQVAMLDFQLIDPAFNGCNIGFIHRRISLVLFTIAKDRQAGFSIIAIGFILSGDSAVSHGQPMKTNPATTPVPAPLLKAVAGHDPAQEIGSAS
jgi:hypothetical protein